MFTVIDYYSEAVLTLCKLIFITSWLKWLPGGREINLKAGGRLWKIVGSNIKCTGLQVNGIERASVVQISTCGFTLGALCQDWIGSGQQCRKDIQTFQQVLQQFSSLPPLQLFSNLSASLYRKWHSSSRHHFSWTIFLLFALLTFNVLNNFSLPHLPPPVLFPFPLHFLSPFLLLLPSHLFLFLHLLFFLLSNGHFYHPPPALHSASSFTASFLLLLSPPTTHHLFTPDPPPLSIHQALYRPLKKYWAANLDPPL